MSPAAPASRRLRTLALACGAALLAFTLSYWTPWTLLEARLYDIASTIAPPEASPPGEEAPLLIVAIDEPSFADLGLQWPWPRSLHGELVEKLREAGARVVALDILFAEPSLPEEDAALAGALGPDDVLAVDETLIETAHMAQMSRIEPPAELLVNGPRLGVVSLAIDGDGVLRRLPPFDDGFADEILRAAGIALASPSAIARTFGSERRYIRMLGPARTYPTVSYYQALDPLQFLPENLLVDRLAVVGFSLQTAPEAEAGGTDAFATAFTALTGRLVAGAEIQATIVDNLRRGLWITEISKPFALLVTLIVAATAAILAWRPAGPRMFVGGIVLVLGILAASFLLMQHGGLWLPPASPIFAALLVLAPVTIADLAAERRQRRAVTDAFAHYLAPELVRRLAEDPSALKLGGERRVLSVLFSDIRGFTTIAEAMKDEPERLTSLVNRLLNPLSHVILDHGGTIDKYIGDCVMAFWNAPIDDPDHARHAVAAGLAMIEATKLLNAELAREAAAAGGPVPMIAVGVGVNTGTCVVGNMGSDLRFDYTAIGDAVNLAARLEGQTRVYDVDIVLGEETARLVIGGYVLSELDRIAVKGRTEATPIYTIVGSAAVAPEADVAGGTASESEDGKR